MKDARKRQRNAERSLMKSLPRGCPNVTVTPTYEERLANTDGWIWSVAVQGNDYIATSTKSHMLSMYTP